MKKLYLVTLVAEYWNNGNKVSVDIELNDLECEPKDVAVNVQKLSNRYLDKIKDQDRRIEGVSGYVYISLASATVTEL